MDGDDGWGGVGDSPTRKRSFLVGLSYTRIFLLDCDSSWDDSL